MTPDKPRAQRPSGGAWAQFADRRLFDYSAAARRLWLVNVGAGAASLVWALFQLQHLSLADTWPAAMCLALVALAAAFPVRIPRTAYSLSAADIFIFLILATTGTPVAVLASGLEGAIASWRTSKRLSSRLGGPMMAMMAMTVCGAAYSAALQLLLRLGLFPGPAALTALCAVALLPYLLAANQMFAMLALKRGTPPRPREWLAGSSWVAAVYLVAAFIAGLIYLNAQLFGLAVLAVAATAVLAMVLLLRVTLRRQEAERQVQEARVAEAQHEAELSQRRFTAAFTHAAIGMAIVRAGGAVLQVNQALCTLLGRSEAELMGAPFGAFLPQGEAAMLRRRTREGAEPPEEPFSMELRCSARDGSDVWVVLHCSRYQDPGGFGHCLILQLHDITSRHQAESRLHHIAYHDSLTDLANRACFHERLEVAVERSRLDANERFAVLFLDLDRFKIVNDSLGHIAGNELLCEVARRLRVCVRPNDLVARLGGDEFAILLEALHDANAGMRLAHRVLEALNQPLVINGTEVVTGASVGITFSDMAYRTVDEVLRDADLAMYAAKAAGRGSVALFDISMLERVAEKLALEADLRRAIGEGQLSVQFQPIYELEPHRLYGFEALARWVHPQRGPISPAVFIALAEESGHIEALTDWIIEHAVSKLAAWRRAGVGIDRLSMHVNISGRDLARDDLATYVQQVLAQHNVPPQQLTLEITETTLMGRLDVALKTMDQVRRTGVGFSIDDFGTGYSSLAYLSTLPIESLKIDGSFVMGMHEKPQNIEIVRAVLTLGKTLGRKVIAEGVETAEQLAALRQLGVPIAQGYLLSRPLHEEQVEALLAISSTAAA